MFSAYDVHRSHDGYCHALEGCRNRGLVHCSRPVLNTCQGALIAPAVCRQDFNHTRSSFTKSQAPAVQVPLNPIQAVFDPDPMLRTSIRSIYLSQPNSHPQWFIKYCSGRASVDLPRVPSLRPVSHSSNHLCRRRSPVVATRHRNASPLQQRISLGLPSLRSRRRQFRLLVDGRAIAAEHDTG